MRKNPIHFGLLSAIICCDLAAVTVVALAIVLTAQVRPGTMVLLLVCAVSTVLIFLAQPTTIAESISLLKGTRRSAPTVSAQSRLTLGAMLMAFVGGTLITYLLLELSGWQSRVVILGGATGLGFCIYLHLLTSLLRTARVLFAAAGLQQFTLALRGTFQFGPNAIASGGGNVHWAVEGSTILAVVLVLAGLLLIIIDRISVRFTDSGTN